MGKNAQGDVAGALATSMQALGTQAGGADGAQIAGIGSSIDLVNSQARNGNMIGALDSAGTKIGLLSGNANLSNIGTNAAQQV